MYHGAGTFEVDGKVERYILCVRGGDVRQTRVVSPKDLRNLMACGCAKCCLLITVPQIGCSR